METALPAPKPLPLAVAIITLNEEANLARCLKSVRDLVAEIVMLDSGSTDNTAQIAAQYGAVFEFRKWEGYIAQKNAAFRRCSQPWVLCLDADEALTPELAGAIRDLFVAGEPPVAGYWVNRRTFYLGRWIWHAWYPEWRLRLVRNRDARWCGGRVHEELTVAGATARLTGDLLHYPFRNLQEHFLRTIKYAHLSAESFAGLGKRCRWYHLFLSPWCAFFQRLVLKQGWRDGWRGWLIAGVKMVNVFAKYAFLLERERVGDGKKEDT